MAPSGPTLRVVFPGLLGGKVSRWLVHQGKEVSLNQPIAECDCDTDGGFPETLVVVSPGDGTLIKHLVPQGGVVPKRKLLPKDEVDEIDGESVSIT
jgi:pyruvate/2-oxoglutarate dehydrogenase complex dihydrolipoamide acyltransferase (E2) component